MDKEKNEGFMKELVSKMNDLPRLPMLFFDLKQSNGSVDFKTSFQKASKFLISNLESVATKCRNNSNSFLCY